MGSARLVLAGGWFLAVTGGLFTALRLASLRVAEGIELHSLLLGLALFGLIAGGVLAMRPGAGLRADAARLSSLNTWIVRWAFYAVLLIGLVDLALTIQKVEGVGAGLLGDQLAIRLAQPNFRGTWVHGPLILLALLIALRTRGLGFPWLALLIVAAELAIVLSRFVFSYEQTFMGDLVRFWYSALFLFASAHTLYADGHVRVDVIYALFPAHRKGQVNALGAIVFGVGLCWTILFVGMANARSLIAGPIADFEVTPSGSGLYVKYLMAGYLAFFASTMLLQFVSLFFEAAADWRGEPKDGGEGAPDASHGL